MPSWFLKGFYLRYQGLNGCTVVASYHSLSRLFCHHNITGLGIRSFQKNATFLHYFPFFIKECRVLCVLFCSFLFFIKECCIFCILFHSLQNNGTFFAFFYVLNKRTWRSLRSFTFFIKERKRTLGSFWFHISIYIYIYIF